MAQINLRKFLKASGLGVIGMALLYGAGQTILVELNKKFNFTASPKHVDLVTATSTESGTYAYVGRVVDGDTFELEDGTKVRYIGINTPETVDPRRPVQCFGHEASDFNKKLLANQQVRLVKDVSDTDKYGRLLRYVYLMDGTFANLKLIAEGYAQLDTYPPDVKFASTFKKAQADARKAGLGLWSRCK